MKTIKIFSGIIFLHVITNITMANYSLDDSQVVSDLAGEIISLKHANTILRSEVASKGSLTQAVEKIVAAGYTQPSAIATLSGPSSVASR